MIEKESKNFLDPKNIETDDFNKYWYLKKYSNSIYSVGSETDKKIIKLSNKDIETSFKNLINNEWFILILDKEENSNLNEIEFIFNNILYKYINKIKVYYANLPKNNKISNNFISKKPLLSIMKNFQDKIEFEIKKIINKFNQIEEFLNKITQLKKNKNKNELQSIYTFGKDGRKSSEHNYSIFNKISTEVFEDILNNLKNEEFVNKLKFIYLKSNKIKKIYITLNLKHFLFLNYKLNKIEILMDLFFNQKIEENELKNFIIKKYLKTLLKNENSFISIKKLYKNKDENLENILNDFIKNNNENVFLLKLKNLMEIENWENINDKIHNIGSLRNIENKFSNVFNLLSTDKNKKISKFQLKNKNNSIDSLKIDSHKNLDSNDNSNNLGIDNLAMNIFTPCRKNLEVLNPNFEMDKNYFQEEVFKVEKFQELEENKIEHERKATFFTAKFNEESDEITKNKDENSEHINKIENNNFNFSNKKLEEIKEKDLSNGDYDAKYNNINSENDLILVEYQNEIKENHINLNKEELKNNIDNNKFISDNNLFNKNLIKKKNLKRTNTELNIKEDFIVSKKSIQNKLLQDKYKDLKVKLKKGRDDLKIQGLNNSINIDSSFKNTFNQISMRSINSINNNFKTKTIQNILITERKNKILKYSVNINCNILQKDNLNKNINLNILNLNDMIIIFKELFDSNLPFKIIIKQLKHFFMKNNYNFNLDEIFKDNNLINDFKTNINNYRTFLTYLFDILKLIKEKQYCNLYEKILNNNLIIFSFFEILFYDEDFQDFLENIILFEKKYKYNYKNESNLDGIYDMLKEISINILNSIKYYIEKIWFENLLVLIKNNNTNIISIFIQFINNKINLNQFLYKVRKFSIKNIFSYPNINNEIDEVFHEKINENFLKLIGKNYDWNIKNFLIKNLNDCNPYILGLVEFYNLSKDYKNTLDFLNTFLEYKNKIIKLFINNNFKEKETHTTKITFEQKLLEKELLKNNINIFLKKKLKNKLNLLWSN